MAKFELKRPTRLVSVCLDGDLTAEYESLQAQLTDARRARLADGRVNSPVAGLEKKQAELYAAQQEQTVTFQLRGLPRHEWDALKTANPARKDNDLDEQFGFNHSVLFDAVMESDGTIVEVTQAGEVVEFSKADWTELAPSLTDGQWGDFVSALAELNAGKQSVPFSLAGYKKMQASAEKSK